MGGQIKVVKKDGPGTLMRLSLVLGLPVANPGKHFELEPDQHNLMVSSPPYIKYQPSLITA